MHRKVSPGRWWPGQGQPALVPSLVALQCSQDRPLHLLASPSGPGIPLKSYLPAFCTGCACEILREGKIITPDPCRAGPSPLLWAGRDRPGCRGAQVRPWARLVVLGELGRLRVCGFGRTEPARRGRDEGITAGTWAVTSGMAKAQRDRAHGPSPAPAPPPNLLP